MKSVMSSMRSILAAGHRALELGDPWTCVVRLREAMQGELSVTDLSAAVSLARLAGDEWAAVELGQRLRGATGDSMDARYALAEALTDCGRAGEAVELLHPALATLDDDRIFKVSRMLMFAGQAEAAHGVARQLLARHADSPTLWERLAQTRNFSAADAGDIDAMRRVERNWPIQKPAGRAAICSALAKAMVDIGDDAGARHWLSERAAANRTRFAYDPGALEAATRDIEIWCAAGGAEGEPSFDASAHETPVFVLGPNRSGTTLVDQILSQHPDVGAGGERRHFWMVTRALGDCSSGAIDAWERSNNAAQGRDAAQGWREIGSRYLRLSREVFGARPCFTDKLLSNIYRVRAITQSMPRAKIIFVRRNPLAVAWSCWRGQFDGDSAWANSSAGVAQYVYTYRRAMTAWATRYPDTILTIDYEDLVRKPDIVIPELLNHCGLADHPETRSPHKSKRSATTLSFDQVRQPIHAGSIDAAASFPLASHDLRAALDALDVR